MLCPVPQNPLAMIILRRSRRQLAHLLSRRLAWQQSQGLLALNGSLSDSSYSNSSSSSFWSGIHNHNKQQHSGFSTSSVASINGSNVADGKGVEIEVGSGENGPVETIMVRTGAQAKWCQCLMSW
jgi:hypothetical protein